MTTSVPNSSGRWINLSPFESDEFGIPRAYVQFMTSTAEDNLASTMENCMVALARALANGNAADLQMSNPERDPLGSTYHEGGTLWMGADSSRSVTDPNGCFHHVSNAYCADQALFVTVGSVNPTLTGLTLARKVSEAVVARARSASARLVQEEDWLAGRRCVVLDRDSGAGPRCRRRYGCQHAWTFAASSAPVLSSFRVVVMILLFGRWPSGDAFPQARSRSLLVASPGHQIQGPHVLGWRDFELHQQMEGRAARGGGLAPLSERLGNREPVTAVLPMRLSTSVHDHHDGTLLLAVEGMVETTRRPPAAGVATRPPRASAPRPVRTPRPRRERQILSIWNFCYRTIPNFHCYSIDNRSKYVDPREKIH
jgi:GMC oxidoreductase